MYKLHLILKYLRRRRIAWVSLFAVMLCTMMVLVVISVMSGWIGMFRSSFHGLSGDVLVKGGSLAGFPYYQQMIERIEQLPEVEAAMPTISTFGLINIANLKTAGVQVLGFPIDKVAGINEFPRSLYRGYNQLIERADDKTNGLSSAERQALRRHAEEMARHPSFDRPLSDDEYRMIASGSRSDVTDPKVWPGMICSVGVLDIRKDSTGKTKGRDPWLYRLPVKLTVMGVGRDSFSLDASNKSERHYWIVDDSRTQVWQYDANTVYVPLERLQEDLRMDEQVVTDKLTGKQITTPARVTDIHVKLRPGTDINAARDKIHDLVDGVIRDNGELVSAAGPKVETWEEDKAMWLHAVENERSLMIFLFGIISVVAVFLIFCIFYMIVTEKTRDIGIIKSVGASAGGVAGIFLGYGAVIGVVGAALGVLSSYLLVHNINEIHDWLGRRLGLVIWNPEVYLFDKIPNTMQNTDVLVIATCAVVASVVGALAPALRAARMNPIEALRWE